MQTPLLLSIATVITTNILTIILLYKPTYVTETLLRSTPTLSATRERQILAIHLMLQIVGTVCLNYKTNRRMDNCLFESKREIAVYPVPIATNQETRSKLFLKFGF